VVLPGDGKNPARFSQACVIFVNAYIEGEILLLGADSPMRYVHPDEEHRREAAAKIEEYKMESAIGPAG